MKTHRLVFALCMLALALPADAQEVVASSVVNGRPVQIMSDFTWRYKTDVVSECQSIDAGIEFCGKTLGWVLLPQTGSKDVNSVFRLNDRSYGLFIVEKLGTQDGVSLDAMRSAVLRNAADRSGIQLKDLTTFGVETGKIGDLDTTSVSYALKADGIPIVFTNTVVMDKHRAVQVATYGVGDTLTDERKANHKQFLAATHFK